MSLKPRVNFARDVEILKSVLNGSTFSDIGAKFRIGGTRAAQVCSKLLRRIRHPSIMGEDTPSYQNVHELRLNKEFWLGKLEKLIERGEEIKKQEKTRVLDKFNDLSPDVQLALRKQLDQVLFRPVDDYDFSVRVLNCFKAENIRYIGDLIQYSESDLKELNNFGRKSIDDTKFVLADHGLSCGMRFHWNTQNGSEGLWL